MTKDDKPVGPIDAQQAEAEAFLVLKAILQEAFAAPQSSYVSVSAEDIFRRNRRRSPKSTA